MTRTVHVVDTTAPTITLTGGAVTLECNIDTYVEPGVAISDDCDNNPTLTVGSDVDESTPGTYTVTYTATDASGNTTTATRTVHVVDTTPPDVVAALTPAGKVEEDEGTFLVEFSCSDGCDTNPGFTGATLNGIAVENGQLVKLEVNDDEEESKFDDGILKMEAPSFELAITCEDASGNVSTATATPAFAPEDEGGDDDGHADEDKDKEDGHDKGKKKGHDKGKKKGKKHDDKDED